ncbi:glycosyl transferase [Sphingobium sp. 22B]|uniref:glycosyltransferase family 2 protein n=1 Tax=unclassified Sphingobium TaxID=2611147 RepID=UPI000782DCB2|nr:MULTISPECIES: glycosyltransferase [unclassified Sphingobium]KXU31431.1 glycosyl transferase [Sphingobium sp. AM]KYC34321.1 glycosyl transferase [Sphingobium sp. 22B]OAP33933.1 glycosyl transferase [Sphingobium sp. 20006FA]
MPAVWIAIPTFRRPEQLRHLLEALPGVTDRHDVMVLVADNDPVRQEGAAVVRSLLAEGYGLPITLLTVAQPGLCAVRNAIAAAALDDPAMRFLAMIDDDEWPQPGWLDALLICQAQVGADVVAGPVDSCFVGQPPRWARETLVFRAEERPWGATGMLWASNNLLVGRRAFAMIGAPFFDPRFNRSGGEDLDFLARLHEAGARFGWSPDARVSEWVPAERARLSWVLKRMWRIGCTETMARRKALPGRIGAAKLLARSIAILGLRTAGLAALLLPGARRVDIAGQWVKSWARLYALAGGARSYYGASHYGAL